MRQHRSLPLALTAVAALVAAAGVGAEGVTFLEAVRNGAAGLDGLAGACSVAASPDGAHLYAAARNDDAVAVFARDPATGELTLVEAHFDGVGGVDGLAYADWVVVSPDGAHVYVAGYGDNAVALFARNAASGALTFVATVVDGVGGVDGIAQPTCLAFSPDGSSLYVTGDDSAVAAFARDPASGALSFVGVQRDGVGGVDGIASPYGVAVSPDGNHVYATGYTDNAIAVFARGPATGALTFVEVVRDGVGGVDGLTTAYGVTLSPDGSHVYATGMYEHSVVVFARASGTGALAFVEAETNVQGLTGAGVVAVSADGANVYATGHWDGGVAVFARDSGTGALTFVEAQVDGVGGVDGLAGADSVTTSPDGVHVYVAGSGDDAVATFARDAGTGALAFVGQVFDGQGAVVGFAGAHGAAVSPDGGSVYLVSRYEDALVALARNPATGTLAFVEAELDSVGLNGLDEVRGVAVSPDSAHVYTAAYLDQAVAAFARDGATGALTFVEVERDGLGGVDGLAGAVAVTVSPDGGHVYAAGTTDDAVAVFARDSGTGALTFVQVVDDGVGGVDGLNGASGVAVSPDGGHVYAVGSMDDALAAFARDPATGALTFVEAERDGVNGVDGLNGASGVAVSPDGGQVYASGAYDGAVAVFARNPSTGALSFRQVARDGVGGVDGLYGASSVAVSPDGALVFATGASEDALAVFAREPVTGRLTFLEVERDGAAGVDGLDSANQVATSPGGRDVYVASVLDDALAAFAVDDARRRSLAAASRADSRVHLLSGDLRRDGSSPAPADLPDGLASDGRLLYTAHAASGEVVASLGGLEQWRWDGAPADLADLEVVGGQLALLRPSSVDFHAAAGGAFVRSIPAPCAATDLAFDGLSLHLLCPTTVVAVDPSTGAVRSTVASPAAACTPSGLASMAGELVVACSDGQWFAVRPADGALLDSGSTGLALSGLAALAPQQLLLSQDSNPAGLFRVDPFSGAASPAGASAVTAGTVGLAPTAEPGVLRGTTPDLVAAVWADDRYARALPGSAAAEGLAWCASSDTLYGTADGTLLALSSRSGLLVGPLSPPGVDLEGLACDPVAGRLYGLGDSGSLWAYDVAGGSWSTVGDTGLVWDDAGLAWDPTRGLLYALAAGQGDALYRLDPATAAASLVGPLGLAPPHGGGLAVLPSWRLPLPRPVFLDGFESGDAAAWDGGVEP